MPDPISCGRSNLSDIVTGVFDRENLTSNASKRNIAIDMKPNSSQIGPYKVAEEIGRGRTSVVYKATDTRNDQIVALKIFSGNGNGSKTDLNSFIQDGENASKLDHPNIVKFYDKGKAEGYHYIAIELIATGSLAAYLQQSQRYILSIDETIKIIHQAADGLDYAHRQGFIHHDIKPSNILINKEQQVFIADFSLAQLFGDSASSPNTTTSSIDSPKYMSPEQAKGELKIDYRTDIYSLAVVAYHLLTGRLPHDIENHQQLIHSIIYDTPVSPEEINSQIPLGVAYAVNRAMSKEAPMRFGSAGSFANALAEGKTWVPSATAYEFLDEPTSNRTSVAQQQTGADIPYVAHTQPNNGAAPTTSNRFWPLITSVSVGLLGLLFVALLLLSQNFDLLSNLSRAVLNGYTGSISIPANNDELTSVDSGQIQQEMGNDTGVEDAIQTSLNKALDSESQNGTNNATIASSTERDNSAKDIADGIIVEALGQSSAEDTAVEPDNIPPTNEADENASATSISLAPYIEYRDPNNRYMLEVPSLWRRNGPPDNITFNSAELFARLFVREMGTLDEEQPPQSVIAKYIEENANSFTNLTLIEGSDRRLANGSYQEEYDAVWLNKDVIVQLNVVSGADEAFIIGLIAEPETSDMLSASFERVSENFEMFAANSESSTQTEEEGERSTDEQEAASEGSAVAEDILLPTSTPFMVIAPTKAPTPTRSINAAAQETEDADNGSSNAGASDLEISDLEISDSEVVSADEPSTQPTTVASTNSQPPTGGGVSRATNTPRPTPTSEPTDRSEPTDTTDTTQSASTAVSTRTPEPTSIPVPTITPTTQANLILDFEEFGSWQLGTQPWGTFTQSNQQIYAGASAGRFDFDFPASAGNQNYLAYYRSIPIEAEPEALQIQVYGDNSGVYLNAWVTDATNQTWQFTFGTVDHAGWQAMRSPLSLERGWPNGIIGNTTSDLSRIRYPIQLTALVIDGIDNNQRQSGTIYVDNLIVDNASEGTVLPEPNSIAANSVSSSLVPSSSVPSAAPAAPTATTEPTPTFQPTNTPILPTATPISSPTSTQPPPTVASNSQVASPAGAQNQSQPSNSPAAGSAQLTGKIAYTQFNRDSGNMDTYIYDLTAGQIIRSLPNNRQPNFSPDGSLLTNGEGGGTDDIVRVGGPSGIIPITKHAEDAHPSWSSSSVSMVYASTRQGDDRSRIYLKRDATDRDNDVTLIYQSGELFGRYPIYLDNWRIAYRGCNTWSGGSSCGIYVTATDGSKPAQASDQTSDIPTDSLGAEILFTSKRDNNWDVYRANWNGSGLQRLTTDPAEDGLAAASPDQQHIAFVSSRGGSWAVYVMQADGSNQRKLFDISGYGQGSQSWQEERLSWGP